MYNRSSSNGNNSKWLANTVAKGEPFAVAKLLSLVTEDAVDEVLVGR